MSFSATISQLLTWELGGVNRILPSEEPRFITLSIGIP